VLAFIDESGDAGLKIDRGSSRLFLVAMVTFQDAAEAQRCEDRIGVLRAELSLPPGFEFHFSRNSWRVREAFLGAVRPFAFRIHVFAVDKVRLLARGDALSPEHLLQLAVRELFEDAGPHLQRATVVIDRAGTRQGRNHLAAYLRNQLSAGALSAIRKLKDQRSGSHDLLQLADYVAGVAARVLNGHPEGHRLRGSYLHGKELTWCLWP
jgi:hypothetical protein